MKSMETKKTYQISLFVVFCILINYVGKLIADYGRLPLWLDSIGTLLSAYMLGPVCGAVVGATNNILFGMQDPIVFVYAITNICIGLLAGIFAKRRFLDSIFLTTSVGVLITVVSVGVSTVLNIWFFNGMTGNIWGDGVIGYMVEHGYPAVFCYIAGEFYIDFLDKQFSLVLLYFLNHFFRHMDSKKKDRQGKYAAKMMLLMLFISAFHTDTQVLASEIPETKQQFTSYVQTVYNSENQLSCGEANAIAQTNDGILWIGTYAGLYRYNGSDMRLMDDYTSVKNVNCLYVDEEGRLWIGTNDNGISICIHEEISNIIDEEKGLPSNSVRGIVQAADGYYYIGTSDSMQILSLNGGLSMIREVEEISYAISMDADNSGYVAAVDATGKLYLLKEQNVVEQMVLPPQEEQFVSCAFDASGLLYAATSSNHVYVYDVSENTFHEREIFSCGELSNINYIYFSEEGTLFLCADNGIGYFDEANSYHDIYTGSFNNSIDNMMIDYQGNMWFASSRIGVLRLCKSCFTDLYTLAGLEKKVINTVEAWNGYLYIGTDTGLDVINPSNNQSVTNELTEQLAGMRIRCIQTDSDNHLWICTYDSGLWEVTKEDIRVYDSKNQMFGDRARVVLEMSDRTIAAAGENGICFIRNGEITGRIAYGDGLSNTMILSLMEMEDGTLLAGTDGDGIAVIKNQKVVSKITRETGLSSGVVLRTVKDNCGDGVFIVTSNGLCYLHTDGSVDILSDFPYFNNYDIWQSEEGKLFVLGSAGIYVIDRDALFSGKEINYELLNREAGLTGALTANSWNYCEDNRYLYLSSDSGVFKVDMNHYKEGARTYRMMLSSIKVDGVASEVERGTPISVSRDANKIEIFPEVINYSIEDPYVSYYLEGIDHTKVIVPQSELTGIVYTNIPSGTYRFHLEVLDNTKTQVLEEIVYVICKEKEIYDNQWFQFYMIAVLVLAVAWLTWFIVRTQIQRTISIQRKELDLAKNKIEMGNQTILAIANTVDAKDENTSHHSQRVSEYSVMIAKELGMSEVDCENLRKIALLHDIGKIGIPDSVLNKPGRLDDAEYEIMKSHVVKGAEILKDFTLIDRVWEGALYHHERYDGKGYVSGLKGKEIPQNARIIGIADAFDAMTANRVYRKKLDFSFVLEEIKKGRGTQFDPKCVDILLKLIDEGKINIEELYSEEENK